MKNLKYFAALFFITVVLGACKKDLLDSVPRDQYSDAVVWKDSLLVNLFVNGIYQGLPSEYESITDLLGNYTDESTNRLITGSTARSAQFNQDLTISSTGPFASLWGNYFAKIRQCNLFLKNVDESNASVGLKNRLTGEVRFLRALYYHYLYNYFGRFPIITEVLGQDDNLFIPRSTDARCIEFMTSELAAAAQALPVKYTGSDVGRATKGAAFALQGRIYLYAGQWQNASDACAAVVKLNTYSLFSNYETMFYPQNENNSEVVFDRQYLPETTSNQYNFFDFYNDIQNGYNNPSGNLVDSYEMKDGTKFNWNNPIHAANPYANRDPRLDATINHDGSTWKGQKLDLKRGTVFNPSTSGTVTSYCIRKFLNPAFVIGSANLNSGQNFIIIRYAEVLLNYAEAQMNLGNMEEARKYVNLIRARPSVAMPAIAKEDFNTERYRNERKIELAFEGLRLWDINRWKIGPETRGVDITGVSAIDMAGVRSYQRIVARAGGVLKKFVDRMYLFPIPLSEIQKYPLSSPLEQNPGW